MKLLLTVVGMSVLACIDVSAQTVSASMSQAPIMSFSGIATTSTGKRKVVTDAALERVAKIRNPQICPVFTDSELEALIVDSNDALILKNRYGQRSSAASTLGSYTDMKVMKACEKQARRIVFFWDDHSIDSARKRYVQTK